MVDSSELFKQLCSYDNLYSAYLKSRKHKIHKKYVLEFEQYLRGNLLQLQHELLAQTYLPQLLTTFVIRDPKTRMINKSHFRDRIVHHALCAIIEPIFEKTFIYDSYANRKGKGTLKAIVRFDVFKRKASRNFTRRCYTLKADIRHYFETVDHRILLELIEKKLKNPSILWLISTILSNHCTTSKNKGMPLGNLTSQFFANIYLNELDHFVKNTLRAKYYLRYVDDFVILHSSKQQIVSWKNKIDIFLKEKMKLELHPDKSKIISLVLGVPFLVRGSAETLSGLQSGD